jgi:hypothetical protein
LEKRRAAFRASKSAAGVEVEELRREYEAMRKEAAESIRRDREERRRRAIVEGVTCMTVDPKASWRWAADVGGWKGERTSGVGVQPILDERGKMLTNPEEIHEAWSRHYQRLATDETGHSKSWLHWVPKVEDWDMPHLSDLDDPFTIKELYRATLRLKNYKAPGEDGITAEWMKMLLPPWLAKVGGLAALEEDDWEEAWGEDEGPSKMALVVLGTINRVWEEEYVPQGWRVAELVNVFKKGDPLVMDNYRGISLMPLELKVLTIMMTARIMRVLEAKGLLAREQAGFRWREECPGQVAALVEAVQRRREEGLLTFLMFVDLSKAYDVVPHEAMFAKLHQIGVRGRMLGFIRALYESSEVRVRGAAGTFKLDRGLRQGCPLSPILFDIFINDLYGRPDALRREFGVEVPGVPAKEGLLAGLLFADDLVAIAKNRADMRSQAHNISLWCSKWEMKVGIKKCGVMCMGDKDHWGATSEQIRLSLDRIRISGEDVPVVEEYTYLGVVVTRDLDLQVMAEGRLEKAKRALAAIRPWLRDQSIPVAVRVLVFKTRVLSSVLYGSEVWGMVKERSEKAQTQVVNKGLRMIMGTREKDTRLPVAALWREFGIAPVYALAAGRKARAFKKFGSLKTWIGVMFQYPFKDRYNRTWIASTDSWLRTFFEKPVAEGKFNNCLSKEDKERLTYSKRVVRVVWAGQEELEKSEGFKQYVGSRFGVTAWSSMRAVPMAAVAEQVRLGRGLRLLSWCRTNALPTAARMATPWEGSKKPPPLPEEYQTRCPCCGQVGEGETIEHIIVECSRWTEQRNMYLKPLMDSIVEQHLPSTGKCICIKLLGGEYGGERLSGWLPSKPKRSEAQMGHPGQEEIISGGAFRMARFLQAIERSRALILRQARRRAEDGSPLQTRGPESLGSHG